MFRFKIWHAYIKMSITRIKLYNTLSAKKEKLIIPKNGLNLFVCGPTVYDLAHIGHARTYIAFDAFVRFLRSRGIKVFYLQNITDVDDKIIARARETKVNPLALSRRFTREYFKDMKSLDIRSINAYAPASAFIPEIVRQIKTLIKKGRAYKIEGEGYYFDLKTFPEYGKLAKRTAEQAEDAVSRIDEGVNKRNKGDFALWKFSKTQIYANRNADLRRKKIPVILNGEPAWFTELGWGRPGWHIEDTAITDTHFGPQYDIHGGGIDIKFPHHESEIAQQEAASGKKPFVKIWMHTGHLLVNGKKMSKSAHNFITIRNFIKDNSPQIIRFMTLAHHYRSPMDYTPAMAEQAKNSLRTIDETLSTLAFISNKATPVKKAKGEIGIQTAEKKFHRALEDDFNTPEAIAALFGFINAIQHKKWTLSGKEAKNAYTFISKNLGILGVQFKQIPVPAKAKKAAQEREKFRLNKQFIKADALRKKMEGLGYVIDDTPMGPCIRKKYST